jgi:Mu-like prophage I protein.
LNFWREIILKGCSVGIMINEMKESGKECVASKTELIEASLVAIPADAGAVILYDSNRKQLSVDEFKTLQATFLTNTNTNMEEKKEPVKPDAKDEEIAQLKAELAANKQQRIDAVLAAAVAQGKISEAEKPHFAKLAEADLESVQAIIDARETKQGMSLKDLQHNAASHVTPGRESWTYLEWMKKDPQGLKAMRSNNPKEFERLQNTLK